MAEFLWTFGPVFVFVALAAALCLCRSHVMRFVLHLLFVHDGDDKRSLRPCLERCLQKCACGVGFLHFLFSVPVDNTAHVIVHAVLLLIAFAALTAWGYSTIMQPQATFLFGCFWAIALAANGLISWFIGIIRDGKQWKAVLLLKASGYAMIFVFIIISLSIEQPHIELTPTEVEFHKSLTDRLHAASIHDVPFNCLLPHVQLVPAAPECLTSAMVSFSSEFSQIHIPASAVHCSTPLNIWLVCHTYFFNTTVRLASETSVFLHVEHSDTSPGMAILSHDDRQSTSNIKLNRNIGGNSLSLLYGVLAHPLVVCVLAAMGVSSYISLVIIALHRPQYGD